MINTTQHKTHKLLKVAADIPICLQALSPWQKSGVGDSLSNDEAALDDELTKHFVREYVLTAEQAAAAMTYGQRHLVDPFFELFDLTDEGDESRRDQR